MSDVKVTKAGGRIRVDVSALDEEIARLRSWTGVPVQLECIHCRRKPIYGLYETVGSPGKALCRDCRAARDIVSLKNRLRQIAELAEAAERECLWPAAVRAFKEIRDLAGR